MDFNVFLLEKKIKSFYLKSGYTPYTHKIKKNGAAFGRLRHRFNFVVLAKKINQSEKRKGIFATSELSF